MAGCLSRLIAELETLTFCEEYMPTNYVRPLYCPKCGCEDLTLESSLQMEVSILSCDDCEFEKRGKCDEETLIERWNKLKRKPKEVLQAKFEANPW